MIQRQKRERMNAINGYDSLSLRLPNKIGSLYFFFDMLIAGGNADDNNVIGVFTFASNSSLSWVGWNCGSASSK